MYLEKVINKFESFSFLFYILLIISYIINCKLIFYKYMFYI